VPYVFVISDDDDDDGVSFQCSRDRVRVMMFHLCPKGLFFI